MIVFHNPGLIEPNAFRLSGASVKAEGSFGRFGTGLKYAIATILRNQGIVTVHSGDRTFSFELETAVLKERCFSEVVLVENLGEARDESTGTHDRRTPLGFTSSLGKDWEPWMAVRELGCNARDEGGDFTINREFAGYTGAETDNVEETVIVVDWPLVEDDWEAVLAQTFAPAAEPLLEEGGVRVLPGPSDYLYHRGVRVWKLPKPSLFTYDVIGPVDLTEDRTVKYGFCVTADVRNTILATSDRSIIAAAVTARDGTWESSLDWSGAQWAPKEPGLDWLEEVAGLRETRQPVTKSAADVFLSHSAIQKATHYSGGTYETMTGTFGEAGEQLAELGVNLEQLSTYVTEALPGDAKTTVRGGAVYASRALIEGGSRLEIAREMLTRYLEVKSGGSFDALLGMVVPLLLDLSYDLKNERVELEESA